MHDIADAERQGGASRVYVLEISHRHGTDHDVYRTEEGALRALAAYVRSYWSEVEQAAGPLEGLTDEEAIDAYFEAYSWHSEPETYELSAHNVRD